jgi:hypothetical protein
LVNSLSFTQLHWILDMAFKSLSTANLPDPAIDPAQGSSPEDYFGTLLWSGDDNATRTIQTGGSGVTGDINFTPDFSWIKRRNGSSNGSDHMLLDAVRGVGSFNALSSNGTQEEGRTEAGSFWTNFGDIDAFTTDGFTVQKGSDPSHTLEGINQSGGTYVAWNWKAGTSVSGSTTGSGTSQSYTGSVSPISGFGIIGYAGNGTAGHSIPHHLDSAPEVVIVKRRTGGDNWAVTTPDVNRLYLNGTNDAASINYNWADQDGSVVTLNGTDAFMNATSNTYIMYCFHSVEGYSKFGSYTGNGTTGDGPFVYTGFRPAVVILKASTVVKNWIAVDTARDTYNTSVNTLFPHSFSAEFSQDDRMDMLSNGFKIRGDGSSDQNLSGETFIYMAFAENPFKYSNAR